MTLTNRDKKLLIILAVVLLVVGMGAGVIFPLLNKGQELKEQTADAQLKKQEQEQKITLLPTLQKTQDQVMEGITETQQSFYPMMKSMEIDQMLTEMALAQGMTIKSMDITMPAAGESAILIPYTSVLEASAQTDEESTSLEEKGVSYNGMYTAKVEMTMEGDRALLQKMLDACAAQEPKMRVSQFLWETTRGTSGDQTLGLSITLEVYMYDSVDQYIQEQKDGE